MTAARTKHAQGRLTSQFIPIWRWASVAPGSDQGPGVLIDAADEALIACKQANRGTYKIVNV